MGFHYIPFGSSSGNVQDAADQLIANGYFAALGRTPTYPNCLVTDSGGEILYVFITDFRLRGWEVVQIEDLVPVLAK